MAGQQPLYKLKGEISVKNGKTHPYELTFTVKNGIISGSSTTWLADGSRPQTKISGTVNRKQNTIFITEDALDNREKNNINCFISATLSFKPVQKKYTLSGDFKGHDNIGMYCGEGTISFDESQVPRGLLRKDTSAIAGNKQVPSGTTGKPAMTTAPTKSDQIKTEFTKPSAIKTMKTGREQTSDTTVVAEQDNVYEITAGVVRQFEWRSDTCIVEIYDGGVVDGDEITLEFNDVAVLSNYTLTQKKKMIKLYLSKKVNKVAFIADREGKIPPNTADIILTDGYRRYRIKAYNTIGETALIKINTAK